MTTSQAFFRMFMLWVAWGVISFFLIVKRNKPPTRGAVRRLLVRRIKAKDSPRLCGYHTGASMRPFHMAIIDGTNCEECKKNK